MKGFLTHKDDKWLVQWTDLHTMEGPLWMYTEISPKATTFPDISTWDESYEGKEVDVEFYTAGYDQESFAPITYARQVLVCEHKTDKIKKYNLSFPYVKNVPAKFADDLVSYTAEEAREELESASKES
jgi:hypothetical protein